jgi:hypothetical protein
MANEPIKNLFANDIHRRIEEVIKVDQTSDDILRDEINEYVVTDAIRSHYTNIFDAFRETPNKPHEGIAIWVSGFFGSGKSSFAKCTGFFFRAWATQKISISPNWKSPLRRKDSLKDLRPSTGVFSIIRNGHSRRAKSLSPS